MEDEGRGFLSQELSCREFEELTSQQKIEYNRRYHLGIDTTYFISRIPFVPNDVVRNLPFTLRPVWR